MHFPANVVQWNKDVREVMDVTLQEQSTAWYLNFIKVMEIENEEGDGSYKTFSRPTEPYIRPQKMQCITIGEDRVLLGATVDNARRLLEAIRNGRDIALKRLREEIAEDSQYQMNERVMTVMCQYVMKHCGDYFTDTMRHICKDVGIEADGFNKLADLVADYLDAAGDLTGGTIFQYNDGSARIRQEEQEDRARRDRQTAIDIANAPRNVHIEGRIKEGLFGPRFEGTAYTTSTMSQADIFHAYDENRSMAWYTAHVESKTMAQKLTKVLLAKTCFFVENFYIDVMKLLAEHAPKSINLPTLTQDNCFSRPYTFPHLLELIDLIEPQRVHMLGHVAKYYNINVERYMPEHLGKKFIAHYEQTGNCRYDGKDLRFYLAYSGTKADDLLDKRWLHDRFAYHFVRKLEAHYETLRGQKKLEKGIRPDTPVEDYFGELLEQAERCYCISPRGMTIIRDKAATLITQLYESRPKRMLGSTRY